MCIFYLRKSSSPREENAIYLANRWPQIKVESWMWNQLLIFSFHGTLSRISLEWQQMYLWIVYWGEKGHQNLQPNHEFGEFREIKILRKSDKFLFCSCSYSGKPHVLTRGRVFSDWNNFGFILAPPYDPA